MSEDPKCYMVQLAHKHYKKNESLAWRQKLDASNDGPMLRSPHVHSGQIIPNESPKKSKKVLIRRTARGYASGNVGSGLCGGSRDAESPKFYFISVNIGSRETDPVQIKYQTWHMIIF